MPCIDADLPDDFASTTKIHPPWSAQQIGALNAFQRSGVMHPFTCPDCGDGARSVLLAAYHDGWRCTRGCGYRQDWAHAFMADRATWDIHRFTARAVSAEEERIATERSIQAALESARAKQWFEAQTDDAAATYRAQLKIEQERIRRALAHHQPVDGDGGPYCDTCTQEEEQPAPVGWWVPFPCPTVTDLTAEIVTYDERINAPLSDAAVAALNERLAAGDAPRRTVKSHSPDQVQLSQVPEGLASAQEVPPLYLPQPEVEAAWRFLCRLLGKDPDVMNLASVLDIPRSDGGLPLQMIRSHGHADRWAICDRTGRRWHRSDGWVYESAGIKDEELRDGSRFTLAEGLPLARELAQKPVTDG